MINRNTMMKILIAAAVLLMILTIFRKPDIETIPVTGAGKEQLAELTRYITDNYQSPGDYLADLFSEKRIVCLGIDHLVADHINFVTYNVMNLYDEGVRIIGVDFLLAEEQDKIDDLLTQPVFDRGFAEELLFNRIVLFGYQEYVDMLEEVWIQNQQIDEDQEPMHVIGLSPREDYSGIITEDDLQDTGKTRNVIAGNDTEDSYIGKTAVKMIAETDKKALVVSIYMRAFTKFHYLDSEKRVLEMKYPPENIYKMGNYLYDAAGDECVTVLMHFFFLDSGSPYGVNYPLRGIFEQVSVSLGEDIQKYGFTVEGSPFAEIEVTGQFAEGYDDLKLKDFIDGYIFLNRIKDSGKLTVIPGFINESNLERAKTNLPAPKDDDFTAIDLNTYISSTAENYDQARKLFE